MFQDISQSLVLIAFVWGPLVNGGIQMGTLERVNPVAFAWTSGLFSVSKPTIYAG
jgi:hypothetical protein